MARYRFRWDEGGGGGGVDRGGGGGVVDRGGGVADPGGSMDRGVAGGGVLDPDPEEGRRAAVRRARRRVISATAVW